MSNIAIEFENVGKMYRLGRVGTGTLSHDLNRWWTTHVLRKEDPYLKIGETNDRAHKGKSEYVWALRDISFKVEQGDVVGIIGKNGAGKSTLLKLLSRITSPTTGTIRYNGRIASLLEVGTGFHPEMTARENIYMNGSIMGMTKAEITRKLDEIVDFSGVERYLDTPVKRFSSGMTVRLGFAVAAFLEPDILVVDEVLAVGDAEFQKKAIGKMQDISSGNGRTVLFVSHNMAAVKVLCKQGIVLNQGTIAYTGKAEECVNYYIGNNISSFKTHTLIDDKQRLEKGAFLREIEFLEARLFNDPQKVGNNEPIELEIKLKQNTNRIESCQYTVNFTDDADVLVESFITAPIPVPKNKSKYTVRLKVSNHGLTKRCYHISFVAGLKDFSVGARNFDIVRNVLSFEISYYQKNPDKKYLMWYRDWGAVVHNNENIDAEVF